MNTIVKPPIPPRRQREKPGQDLKWIGTNMKRVEDPRLLTGQRLRGLGNPMMQSGFRCAHGGL